MSATKGICPVCSELVTVRLDGLVRAHGYLKDMVPGPKLPCPGTNQVPRETSDGGSFSAICMWKDCSTGTAALVFYQDYWTPLCVRHAKKALS